MSRRDELQNQLLLELKLSGYPEPVAELRFHEKRRWRFDFAWPKEMIALEIDGGVRGKSRHFSAKGFFNDAEKYLEADILYWRVVKTNYKMLEDGTALKLLRRAFESRGFKSEKGMVANLRDR